MGNLVEDWDQYLYLTNLPVLFMSEHNIGQAVLSIIVAPFAIKHIMAVSIMAILLGCSALVSGAEIALFSLSPGVLQKLKSKKDIVKSEFLILKLLSNPRQLLATILIANNFFNVSIVIIATFITMDIFDFSQAPVLGFIIEVIAITFILLLLGEVLPKVYATQNNLKFARTISYPVFIISKILSPLSYMLTSSTNLIDKKLKQKRHAVSVEELDHVIDFTIQDQSPAEEKHLLKGIAHFGSTTVKQVMTSRIDVVAFNAKTRYRELLGKIKESGYSRVPIYKSSLDKIVGILYTKDLLLHIDKDDNFQWQDLMREPFIIPESKKIDNLLKEFQTKKIHFAIVVDEYGGCSGIVTLEDILEEIVGEISDEFDDQDLGYSKIDDNTYAFEGKTPINDICRLMNISLNSFDSVKGDADSCGGLVVEIAGKIPQVNEQIKFKNFNFLIEAVDKRRVSKVKIYVSSSPEL